MASVNKACFQCGMPLIFGIAQCAHCGAKVGTVFDEAAPVAAPSKGNRFKEVSRTMDHHTRVEKAQEKANNAVILALSSFFPILGLLLSIAAMVVAGLSLRTLREMNVEDGRGSATAGLVIAALGFIAQICLVLYALKLISIVHP